MGDECTCEKCQVVLSIEQGASVWQIAWAEAQVEGLGRAVRNLYLVVTDGGIALRQQSCEM